MLIRTDCDGGHALASAESGNARTARSAFFVQSQQASGRREISQMQNFVDQNTQRTAVLKTFLNLLSEIGQQNENVVRCVGTVLATICAMRKIVLGDRGLVHLAR